MTLTDSDIELKKRELGLDTLIAKKLNKTLDEVEKELDPKIRKILRDYLKDTGPDSVS